MEAGNHTRPQSHSRQDDLLNGKDTPCRSDLHHEDLVLVRRLLARDDRAWRQFVVQYRSLILHRIQAAAKEASLATLQNAILEEICSDVFDQLVSRDMKSLRRYSGRAKLSTWLGVVVRRAALRSLSSRLRQPSRPDTAEMNQIPLPPASETSRAARQREQLDAAMGQLPEADQHLLSLCYELQQSYSQIAAALGISENSVGPRLNRARLRLKAVLEKHNTDST